MLGAVRSAMHRGAHRDKLSVGRIRQWTLGLDYWGPLDHWKSVGWNMGISAVYLELYARAGGERSLARARGKGRHGRRRLTAAATEAGLDVTVSDSEAKWTTAAHDTTETME
jgi:hypothetical protein